MEHNPFSETQLSILPKIVGKDFEAKWCEGLDIEAYHGDRTALSSSGLKVLVERTPSHFKSYWTAGMTVDKTNAALRYGSLAHLAILEPEKFKSRFVLEPKFEGLTKDGKVSSQSKEAKDKKASWYSSLPAGSLVVTAEDYAAITGSIRSILAHEKAGRVIVGAKTEISGYFRHSTTGILCKLRPDIYHHDKKVLIDLKTTRDASEAFFSNEIARRNYHLSLAFYGHGIKQITGVEPQVYALLAVEKEPPFATALYTINKETMDTARAWIESGMQTLKQCLETDKWPSYQDGIAEDISIPAWAHQKHLPMFNFDEEEV
jgi:exodeoxyribonuclease VIII